MTLFSAVLFIHVLSAITVFVALTFEGSILFRLRSAETLDELRFPAHAFRRLGPIYGVAFAGILLGGIYLAASLHLKATWVPVALLSTLVLLAVGGIVTGRRMSRIRRALSESQPAFQPASAIANSDALVCSYGFRAGILVGVLYLMTAMPALLTSLLVLTLTCVAGIVVALRLRRTSASSNHDSIRPTQAATRS
jgi:hypothetical protein